MKMHPVSTKATCFTQQKQWGLYQNKVNSSLAAIQRPGHWADNCKMVYKVLVVMQGVTSLTNQKNRKMHWTEKSEKPPSWLTKTENQRLNWRKPANRTRHQNRKTAVFRCENRKTEPKIGQIPTHPSWSIAVFCDFFAVLRYLPNFFCGIAVFRTPQCPLNEVAVSTGIKKAGFHCGSKGKNKG